MTNKLADFLAGDDIEITLNHGTVIKGEICNISAGQLTLLQALTGAYRVLNESDFSAIRLLDRVPLEPWEETKERDGLPCDLVAGLWNGRPDAAVMLTKIVMSRLERSNLGRHSKELLLDTLSQLVLTGDAIKYMNPDAKKTRAPRPWKKANEVWHEVMGEYWSFYNEKPRTLTDSRLDQGIFSTVAENLNMSESSVKRHYYDFLEILEVSKPQRADEIAELLSQLSPRYLPEDTEEQ
jgi:hypothetical protein